MAKGFLVKMWPPGAVVFAVEDDGGGERKVLDGAGHCDARETGVSAMGVDVRDCECWEAEGGGALLAVCRREGRIQSSLSRFRLCRVHMRALLDGGM